MGVLKRLRNEERGAVMIIFAGFLPIAVLLAAWVIDLGNGAEHRRHLQLQADAGALAGATKFNECRTDPTLANDRIRDMAIEYATDRNVQVAGQDVEIVINGTDYDAEENSLGTPCQTGFVDVKLTEPDSPTFFGFVGSNDWHAHARVSAFKLQQLNGLLPVAVPVPEFDNAAAIFVDDETGVPLTDSNGNDVVAPLKETSGTWHTVDPESVPIGTTKHVGVRIALSEDDITDWDCLDVAVTCYDAGSSGGLVHIQGWSNAGSVTYNGATGPQTAPLLRSVTLQPAANCENPYFSSASEPCESIKVRADVDFGGDHTLLGASLTAFVGDDRTPYRLTFGVDGWESEAIEIPAGAGPLDIELEWDETDGGFASGGAASAGRSAGISARPGDPPGGGPPSDPPGGGGGGGGNDDLDECTSGGNNPCEGSFGLVQRHFRASDDRSGPIDSVRLEQGSTQFANSLERCSTELTTCTYPLDVTVEIPDVLQVNGPAQFLRADLGNLTQALDCNPAGGASFVDEIVLGCTPWYEENGGSACPSASDLVSSQQPWTCVQVTSGEKESQLGKALNLRILGDEKATECPDAGLPGHNNYARYVDGDPRVVHVFLTQFGAFDEQGTDDPVPVIGFATFYITAWKGNKGFENPCEAHGDEKPPPGVELEVGELLGHFISYVKYPNDGGAGPGSCDLTKDIRPCTPVLTD